MPITIKCDCGKKFAVGDQHAGKRVRCPGCKSVHSVVAPGGKAQSRGTAESIKADAPTLIRFRCECGKQMQAKVERAGSVIECPACGEEVTVPDIKQSRRKSPAVTAEKPMPDPRVVDDDDDDDEPRQRPKKRKGSKKQGSKMWLVIGGSALALLLVVGGVLAYFMMGDNSKPVGGNPTNTGGRTELPGDPTEPVSHAALIPANAQGFISGRTAEISRSDAAQILIDIFPPEFRTQMTAIEEKIGLKNSDVERGTVVIQNAATQSIWIVTQTSMPYDIEKIKSAAQEQNPNSPFVEKNYNGKTFFNRADGALYPVSDTILVFGPAAGIKACIDQQESPVSDGPLAAMIAETAGPNHLVLAFAEPMKMAPPGLLPANGNQGNPDAQMVLNVVKGLKLVTLVGSITDKLDLTLTATFSDEENVKTAQIHLGGILGARDLVVGQISGQMPAVGKFVGSLLEKLTVSQNGTNLVISLKGLDVSKAALTPVVDEVKKRVAGAAVDVRGRNNIIQMNLAMHAFHDTNRYLPPMQPNPQARHPNLSWRVDLLPFIGQENLYNQIRRNEPYDSEHNKQFWSQMPVTYALPGTDPKQGKTPYQVFKGPNTAFSGQRTGLNQILDGTSNTLMIVEASTPVNWMAPEDLPFQQSPNGYPPIKLGKPGEAFFLASTCDGAVHRIPKSIDPMNLQNLILINDGNVVEIPR